MLVCILFESSGGISEISMSSNGGIAVASAVSTKGGTVETSVSPPQAGKSPATRNDKKTILNITSQRIISFATDSFHEGINC